MTTVSVPLPGLFDGFAKVVDSIGIVTVAALERVLSPGTVELVCCGIAGDDIGSEVAGCTHGSPEKGQIFEIAI